MDPMDDWGLSDKLFDSLEAEHYLKLGQRHNPSSSSSSTLQRHHSATVTNHFPPQTDNWGLSDKLFDSLEAEHYLKLGQRPNPSSSSSSSSSSTHQSHHHATATNHLLPQPLLINDGHENALVIKGGNMDRLQERERGSITSMDPMESELDDWDLSEEVFDSLQAEAEQYMKLGQRPNLSSSSSSSSTHQSRHFATATATNHFPPQPFLINDGRENALEVSASLLANRPSEQRFARKGDNMDRLEVERNPKCPRTDP